MTVSSQTEWGKRQKCTDQWAIDTTLPGNHKTTVINGEQSIAINPCVYQLSISDSLCDECLKLLEAF